MVKFDHTIDLRLRITPLVSSNLTIVLFVTLRFTASDYPFGIVKLDHCVVCHS
jgi:hypothetical protein